MDVAYAYELRRGDEIVSTGRLILDRDVSRGDEVTVAGVVAEVDAVSWVDHEPRLILKDVHSPARFRR